MPPSSPRLRAATLGRVKNARDRTGAAALVGAAVTGLIAFTLFLAGGLLLWANGHYKDADGYLSTGSQRFNSSEYAITTPNLEVNAGAPARRSRISGTEKSMFSPPSPSVEWRR